MRSMNNANRHDRSQSLAALSFVAAALCGTPALVFGQWLHYPTADVPGKSDETPNLAAPPPKLPDGKPNFSGLWHTALVNQCAPETGLF